MRRDYYFNPELAVRYGVDEAIFIHHLAFWLQKNANEPDHIRDGRVWTYDTVSGLCKIFPWWTRRQMERIIRSVCDKGAVETGHFGANLDRTIWYTLSPELMAFYALAETQPEDDLPERGNAFPQTVKSEPARMHQTVECISPNGEMLYGTDNRLTDNPPKIPPQGEDALFAQFWAAYPRKIDKQKALRAWKRQKIKPEELPGILFALEGQKRSRQWQRDNGDYIPHPTTWINNRRWEAEISAAPAQSRGPVIDTGGVEVWT